MKLGESRMKYRHRSLIKELEKKEIVKCKIHRIIL
jgi:hypothetical protein